MGLFGNPEAKNIKMNDANKKSILSQLQLLKMNTKDAEVMKLLAKVGACLQQQGETSRSEVIDVDAQIMELLDQSNEYLLMGQPATAIAKVNQVYGLTVSRQKYCSFGGRLSKADAKMIAAAQKKRAKVAKTKEKSRIDELQEMIDRKNAELHGYEAEFNMLRELSEKYPGNVSLESRGETLITLKEGVDAQISAMLDELAGQVAYGVADKVSETSVKLADGRTYSLEEVALIKEKMQKTQADREALREATGTLRGLVQGASGRATVATEEAAATSTGTTAGSVFGNAQTTQKKSVFDQGMGAGRSSVFGTAAPAGTPAQTQYGGFDASTVGTQQMANEINKTISVMQRNIETYQDKIDDANEEYKNYNNELRRLLEKRKTASPADCLALDGEIDQLNSRRTNVAHTIKRYRQAVAQLSDKLSLMEKLAAQQDVTATNAQIEKLTNGKFSDFAGLSMYINESIKTSNEAGDEIGIAVNISEGEEISMNSASGAAAALADAGLSKDEHKYDSLLEELTPTATPRTLG